MESRLLRYLQIAKEDEYGVEPQEVDFTYDFASADLDSPSDTDVRKESGLGFGSTKKVGGFYSPSGNFVMNGNLDTLHYLFYYTLGYYEFQPGDPEGNYPNGHQIYNSDKQYLPSFTTKLGRDRFEHVFNGCVVQSFQLEVNDGFVQTTTSVSSKKDRSDNVKDFYEYESSFIDSSELSFTDVEVVLVKKDDILNENFDYEYFSKKIKELTINIENTLDPESGKGMGSRHPHRIPRNSSEVTGSLTLYFDSLEEKKLFWGGEDGPGKQSETFSLEISMRDEDYDNNYKGLSIDLPVVYFTEVQTQNSNTEEIVLNCQFNTMARDVFAPDWETGEGSIFYTNILLFLSNYEGAIE